jgi:hypothetical protein
MEQDDSTYKKNVIYITQSVRDWSGILCEREREQGSGTGTRFFWTGFWERDGNMASKDIAESPTRSGTPKRKTTSQQDNKTTSFF